MNRIFRPDDSIWNLQSPGRPSGSPMSFDFLQGDILGLRDIKISPDDSAQGDQSVKEEGSGRIPDRFALYGDFRTGQCEEPDNLEERKGDDAVENPYGQGPERRADAPNPKRKYFRNDQPPERADTDGEEGDVEED